MEQKENSAQSDASVEPGQLQAEIAKVPSVAELGPGYTLKLRGSDEDGGQTFQGSKSLVSKLERNNSSALTPASGIPSPLDLLVGAPLQSGVIPRMSMEVPDLELSSYVMGTVSRSEQKILDALASLEAIGVIAPSKIQLAAFAGYSDAKSDGFAAPMAALISKALAESSSGEAMLTANGRQTSNMPSRPLTTEDLQERIFHLLGGGERKILTLLLARFPESLTRDELAAQGGYSNAKLERFTAPLARLVKLGFVEPVWPGAVRGSEMLFIKGKARGE